MKIEGPCPKCGRDLGVKSDEAVAEMFGDAVQRLMDKQGNAIRCSNCQEYVDPNEDMEVVEE